MDLFSDIFESFCERSYNHSVLVLVLPSSCNDSYYRLAYGILENIPCLSLAHHDNQVQDVADDEGRQQMEQGTQNDILFLVILVLFYGS